MKVKNKFTFVELLLVVSIIVILISLLQPSLLRFKKMALQTTCQNDLHQLQSGFIYYADDNDGHLPDSPLAGNFNDMNAFFLRNQLDWRPIAREYGFMAVTGNPVTGAKTWDDQGNTHNTWKRDSRQYYPKKNLANYKSGTRSPTQLSLASSDQSMFADLLRINPNGGYYGIHGHGGTLAHVPGSSSMTLFFDMEPEGSHIAFMDGATQWVDIYDLKFYHRGAWQHGYYPKAK